MGKSRGPYCEEYPVGTLVKIADRIFLESFIEDWKLHNKLLPEQLGYADKTGTITSVGFYHGGDELYQVDGVPGIWHECCLMAVK